MVKTDTNPTKYQKRTEKREAPNVGFTIEITKTVTFKTDKKAPLFFLFFAISPRQLFFLFWFSFSIKKVCQ